MDDAGSVSESVTESASESVGGLTGSKDGAHRSFEEVHSDGEHNGQILADHDHDHGAREYSQLDLEAALHWGLG